MPCWWQRSNAAPSRAGMASTEPPLFFFVESSASITWRRVSRGFQCPSGVLFSFVRIRHYSSTGMLMIPYDVIVRPHSR